MCLLITMGQAVAGGVDNKQNFSAAYVGSTSRNAATEGADIAAYNPAGIMQMKNGTYLEIDAQALTLDYDHHIDGKDYGISELAKLPTTFAVHKMDKWAVYGTFTVNGGGGSVEYKEGNNITKGIGQAAFLGGFAPALPGGGTFTDEYAFSECYDYTFTTGASYALSDALSVSAGLRYVITDKEVDIQGTYSGQKIIGKYEQDAQGWGGVINLNYRISDTLNFAAKYETIVKLDWYTEIDNASTAIGRGILKANGREHGKEYARDLPAVFATGLEWQVMEQLTLCPSFTYYFEKDADWDTQNEKTDKNSYDIALAVRYKVNDAWTATAGYMYTDVGIKPEDYGIIEKMSPPLDCHTVSLGAAYKMNEKWRFTSGIMGSFYVSDSTKALPPNPETKYEKEVITYAIGVQYTFF
ncbi:MAG: TonB-dependent receptor [Desulfobacterales bacterium]|nr:TonB-dependent receptor [Desulfobacterales bacterium]